MGQWVVLVRAANDWHVCFAFSYHRPGGRSENGVKWGNRRNSWGEGPLPCENEISYHKTRTQQNVGLQAFAVCPKGDAPALKWLISSSPLASPSLKAYFQPLQVDELQNAKECESLPPGPSWNYRSGAEKRGSRIGTSQNVYANSRKVSFLHLLLISDFSSARFSTQFWALNWTVLLSIPLNDSVFNRFFSTFFNWGINKHIWWKSCKVYNFSSHLLRQLLL